MIAFLEEKLRIEAALFLALSYSISNVEKKSLSLAMCAEALSEVRGMIP